MKTTGAAVELHWFRSSYSGGAGGECVEVAACPQAIHVRDSKDIARRGISVDEVAWKAFVGFAVR
ncbi:DUF397 domain-containing protein [Streptomyces olivaceus]|uniref:DUF397 domain-containing protein n=1 Tax=Streptomyces olivaceus TaxID=47716 RepID=UPI0004C98507|nr:DUF397 domain-containing protein [Streptomyces olivaceus]MBZ6084038.1 DUF397 domain-containing protein [Streptomyces olivaceus]MBZ6100944.1 DUF397 domain-containing protein [Streptomyces olivaceus]MBZ6282561.1 DUF397 domain-containing protein [Streptomyces olivaceus]MBZ6304959.1 DUF397 domain-containing protein [Streptomyces olivaceus]MBZ6317777.1 DUF397 domain-containing protein [Streptomyces olivaceus]